MTYDYRAKKIVAVLSSNLEAGAALNVLGHLACALGGHGPPELMGRSRILDGSAVAHVGISKYPLIVTRVRPSRLGRFIREARQEPTLLLADYPEQMLVTEHDDELADALASREEAELSYLGAIAYGPTSVLTELTGKFSLWR